jgi:glycosyltransferase involved in cell wall biosynthesis
VLVPAYNEERTLEELLRRVLAVPIDLEVIAVDDGSTDGTGALLDRVAAQEPRLVAVHHERNLGKGRALRTALARVRGEICIVQDADLEYDPGDFQALIAPIVEQRTNVVYGSRVLHPLNSYPLDRYRMGSFVLTWMATLLYGQRITDEPCGYKVFRTGFLRSLDLRCEGFEFCPEVTAKVMRRGEKIVEVPIRYHKRGVAEGKKIRFLDAIVGAWTLLKYRFRS